MPTMRIACIHLPSFPLQVYLRQVPHLLGVAGARPGAPVVVAGGPPVPGRPGAPTVVACSRSAWGRGIRAGMTVAAARVLAPDVVVVARDPAGERAAARALGEALLAIAGRVDVGGAPAGAHHALYAEVPARMRGATFGGRALEALAALGLRGRVGIADDRFTAWVAASTTASDDDAVVSVPRGGSAAFLAPQPLSLLAIDTEVQQVLAAVGVATLGAFAALPPPSVTRPWDADLQALSRGDGGVQLAPFAPAGSILERLSPGGEVGLGAAVALLAARVAARLAGRERAVAQLAIRATTAAGPRALELAPPVPLVGADDLADALGAALSGSEGVIELEVEVVAETTIDGEAAEVALETPVPVPVIDAPAAAMAAPLFAARETFRLEEPVLTVAPREAHRRTRRGKQRTRSLPGVQSRLFGGLDA
jgi:nucleotidyltransferase/DNA polymerase involved in DNA repair